MGILLDTNVVSELARSKPDPAVVRYLSEQHGGCLSVVTLHELRRGAELVKDPVQQERLLRWLSGIRERFKEFILPITDEIAEHSALMRVEATRNGYTLHIEDAMIAATAAENNLLLATRNVKDFEMIRVDLINPWDVGI